MGESTDKSSGINAWSALSAIADEVIPNHYADAPNVVYGDIRSSFILALAEFLTPVQIRDVVDTVDSYVGNHYGE